MSKTDERLVIFAVKGPHASDLSKMMLVVSKALEVAGYYSVYWRETSLNAASKALVAIEQEEDRGHDA
jgi:hypothetical protein